MISFIAGSGNTGYFGLPVAIALFGNNIIGIVSTAILGTNIYAISVGYFIAAKGHHTIKESVKKVFMLPILYAFIAGVVVNALGIRHVGFLSDIDNSFNGACILLGMMLIGLAISDIATYKIDIKFVAVSFLAKFILWPLLVVCLLFIDRETFKIFDTGLYKIYNAYGYSSISCKRSVLRHDIKFTCRKSVNGSLIKYSFCLILYSFDCCNIFEIINPRIYYNVLPYTIYK